MTAADGWYTWSTIQERSVRDSRTRRWSARQRTSDHHDRGAGCLRTCRVCAAAGRGRFVL